MQDILVYSLLGLSLQPSFIEAELRKVIASRARQSQWEAAISALASITDQDRIQVWGLGKAFHDAHTGRGSQSPFEKEVEADSIMYCAALGALDAWLRGITT